MSLTKPLILYTHGPTPNPFKVKLILAELGLPYETRETTDSKAPDFVKLNPNGRLPALIDPNHENLTLWESGAIIDYLIETYDTEAKLHYTASPEKHTTRCWEHFQMSGQGPYFGQLSWFNMFHPEKLPSAIERYEKELKRVVSVVDQHLVNQGSDYLVGDRVTYADIMFLPWFLMAPIATQGKVDLSAYKTWAAWVERVESRPALAGVLEEWRAQASARRAEREKEN